MAQLEAYSKLNFTPSFSVVDEDYSASTSSNDKSSDDESRDGEEE